MIEKSIQIQSDDKNLCICYYIKNSDDIHKTEVSLTSQLINTNIIDHTVLIFTSLEYYALVKNTFKHLIGLTNIIKVNPLFLNRSFLMAHPRIQKYKIGVIINPSIRITNKFDYTQLVDYHITFPLAVMSRNTLTGFELRLIKTYKDTFQNTLDLTFEELKQILFNCYCSKVDIEKKIQDFYILNVYPDTRFLSFSTRLTKTPSFYGHVKNIMYNGIKSSDLTLRIYIQAKGYNISSLENSQLQLQTILKP